MGCGSSTITSAATSNKDVSLATSTKVLPDGSDTNWHGTDDGFAMMMHASTGSNDKSNKHCGDYAAIIGQKDQSFWVVEKGQVVGQFGKYQVGDLIEIKRAGVENSVRRMFFDFDTDKNGSIDTAELKMLLEYVLKQTTLELEPLNDEDVQAVAQALDTDNNGEIDESEWVSWVMEGLGSDPAVRKDIALREEMSLSKKLFGLLGAVENIILSGCYVAYLVDGALRYVSKRVERSDWEDSGVFVVMKGAVDTNIIVTWEGGDDDLQLLLQEETTTTTTTTTTKKKKKKKKKKRARPVRWIEEEGIEITSEILQRNVAGVSNRTSARSSNEPIKAVIDTKTVGASFIAGEPSGNEEGIILCGLNSFKTTPLNKIFIPKVCIQR